MGFPINFQDFDKGIFVQEVPFRVAQRLLDEDKPQEALEQLLANIRYDTPVLVEEVIPPVEVIELFGRCLWGLRAYNDFEGLMKIADDLGLAQEPEVQFLRVLWDFSSGNSLDAIQAITPLIDVFRDQSHYLTGEALRIRGHNLFCIGDRQQALQDLEAAYGFYLIQEKPFMVARAANTIGLHFVRQSEYKKAAEWFERANAILSDRENPFRVCIFNCVSSHGVYSPKRRTPWPRRNGTSSTSFLIS